MMSAINFECPLVQAIAKARVRNVFPLSGNHIMAAFDAALNALKKRPTIGCDLRDTEVQWPRWPLHKQWNTKLIESLPPLHAKLATSPMRCPLIEQSS